MLCVAYWVTGSDFTVEGFEAVLEYLYTSAVRGATEGEYSLTKMQVTVQAADFFGLPKLAEAVTRWSSCCGINEECETWKLRGLTEKVCPVSVIHRLGD